MTDLLPPEGLEDALAHLARVEGVGGWKGLACFINPKYSDDPEAAGQWLRNAINPTRREAFKKKHFDRAIERGQRAGCHVVWDWYCRDRGYETSGPVDSKSRKMLLLEEDVRLSARRMEIQKELEREDATEALGDMRSISGRAD